MKLVWISDPHFDFLHRHLMDEFLNSVAAQKPDALLITGDISNAAGLEKHLTVLATSFSCPIYFLLGNHDFYGGSFAGVDGIASRLCSTYPNLFRLGYGEIIVLDAGTVDHGAMRTHPSYGLLSAADQSDRQGGTRRV